MSSTLQLGQDSDANLAKKVQYALANPAKVLNFIKMRQRKESMRDVRSLLAKALDVDASTLKFQEHHLEHHIAHIASSYYCSPWESAAGFSYDGSGDFVSTMMARCEGHRNSGTRPRFSPALAWQLLHHDLRLHRIQEVWR